MAGPSVPNAIASDEEARRQHFVSSAVIFVSLRRAPTPAAPVKRIIGGSAQKSLSITAGSVLRGRYLRGLCASSFLLIGRTPLPES